MKFWFLTTLYRMMTGTAVDIDGATIGIKLLGPSNTCEAERATAEFLDDISNLDEYGGSGYNEINATASVTKDTVNLRSEMSISPDDWGTPLADTDAATGMLCYIDTGVASTSRLLWYSEEGFPLNGDGGPFNLTPSASAGLASLA